MFQITYKTVHHRHFSYAKIKDGFKGKRTRKTATQTQRFGSFLPKKRPRKRMQAGPTGGR
jgi:hypothetical protein